MLHHYFSIAIRNIKKNKLSFVINLVGLSLGLASAFIISGYVLKETSYDSTHSKKDRIARVLCDELGVGWTSPGVPFILKENIDNSVPSVEKSCLVDYLYMAKAKLGEEFIGFKRLYSSTPEFFDIFDCKIVYGDLKGTLSNINSLVLTRKTAETYFPNQNPIGNILEIKINSNIYQLKVDAVIEDFPANSSFKFNALCNFNISIREAEAEEWTKEYRTAWHLNFNKMFVLLKDDNDKSFQTSWDQFEEKNNLAQQEKHFHLQKLTDIHLKSEKIVNDNSEHGNKTLIYLFSSIAFVILLIAAFNYIILSISISKMRYKEIGVKKILGSKNSQLRKQFLIESVLISIIAFPVAYAIAFYSIGFFNRLFNISLEINIFRHTDQLFAFLSLILLIGLLSGSYVAFYLSRLKPLDIIKSKLTKQKSKIQFQYLMILFQIIIFAGLTAASFSIYKQIDYLKKADTGINLKNILCVYINDHNMNTDSYLNISKIVSEIPEVQDYTLGYYLPPDNSRGVQLAPHPEDETIKLKYEWLEISYNFFDFYEIQCTAGRVFDSKLITDSSKIVLNESAVKLFEFTNPIGKFIKDREIIGVVKDFHTHSLHEGVAPTVFSLVNPQYAENIAVKYHEGLAGFCTDKLQQELLKFIPDAKISISPIESHIEDLYGDENNLNNIIIYFSVFAMIIALIGIFGQSLFAVKQQFKEIGIRKVNGATTKDIIIQVLRKYMILCIVANLICWPVVYIILSKWQENFTYKSPFSFWLVLFTLGASIFVVFGTVIFNAWKAARTNPVNVLKYE